MRSEIVTTFAFKLRNKASALLAILAIITASFAVTCAILGVLTAALPRVNIELAIKG